MNPKEKVKKKNDLSWNVNNAVTPNDAYTTTPTPNDAYTTTPSDVAAAAAAAAAATTTTIASIAITPTDAYTTTPSDVAAANTIASTAIASITAIAITGQKTAGAALGAAAAAAKAIQLPTTIDAGIDDKGTAATKITQDQATEIYRIQANLNEYATSIEGMCSYFQKHATAYDILSTEDNGNDIGTSKATKSTVSTVCTSPVTEEESTQYISSSLETTKPVLVDKEGTTILVRKVSLMMKTNTDAHTDPAFTDSALLIKKTITLKDYSEVKKKKKMNLVPFKKDQRFWTIDEAEEDADKEDNHDGFSV